MTHWNNLFQPCYYHILPLQVLNLPLNLLKKLEKSTYFEGMILRFLKYFFVCYIFEFIKIFYDENDLILVRSDVHTL